MINRLPVKQVTDKEKQKLIKLVDMITYAKSKGPAFDVTTYEKIINDIIYSWYNLTDAEISIIEGH